MSSGVGVSDECITAYNELMRRKVKYIVYGLNPSFTEVVVLNKSTETDYDTFLKEFPAKESRWAVYDVEYDHEDGGKRNKVMYIYWSPDGADVRKRMVYSASNNTLRGRLGVANEVQANDEADLEWANVLEKAKRK